MRDSEWAWGEEDWVGGTDDEGEEEEGELGDVDDESGCEGPSRRSMELRQ
jgi:hypothetical protein